jgi:membrane protein YdbS with pleckstrin-like domain
MENIQSYQNNQEKYQVIKPAIKTSLLLLQSFLYALVINMFLGWFLSAPLVFILSILGAKGIGAGIIGGITLFIIIFFIVFMLKKASLKKTEYRFYSNKLEYYEGFLVKNRKTINYDKISNIGQRTGIIEGWFGLGTIFIDTAGYSRKGHEVSMPFLENSDKIYDWITNVTSKKK